MKLKSFLAFRSAGAVALLSVAMMAAAQAQAPAGKIHGHVTDPSGASRGNGTVTLSTDAGKTSKYTFPVNAAGDFTGDGVTPGTYTVSLALPTTPAGEYVDQFPDVKVVDGQDLLQNFDMSRQVYLDKMTPEQRKQVEEFKAKNAEILKGNAVVKTLNADLATARADNHDKKYDDAEALMLRDSAVATKGGELVFYELGEAQSGLKKWDDATTSFKKALDLATASGTKPNPELIGSAHSGLGEVYARSGKTADATSEYDLAATANPPKAGFYYANEAVVFSNVGASDAQVAAADKAITADPKNPVPYYLKGQGLAGKITVDQKSGAYIVPPGCAESYQMYLQLAPTGPYAAEAQAVLAETQTKVNSKYKAAPAKK